MNRYVTTTDIKMLHVKDTDEELIELNGRIQAYRYYRSAFLSWWRVFAYTKLSLEIGRLEKRADKRMEELLS